MFQIEFDANGHMCRSREPAGGAGGVVVVVGGAGAVVVVVGAGVVVVVVGGAGAVVVVVGAGAVVVGGAGAVVVGVGAGVVVGVGAGVVVVGAGSATVVGGVGLLHRHARWQFALSADAVSDAGAVLAFGTLHADATTANPAITTHNRPALFFDPPAVPMICSLLRQGVRSPGPSFVWGSGHRGRRLTPRACLCSD